MKKNKIQSMENVLFIGDGMNDIPGLSVAKLSLAIQNGLSHSLKYTQIVFLKPELHSLITLYQFNKEYKKVNVRNFLLTGIFNLFGLMATWTGIMTPLIAVFIMPLMSVSVLLTTLSLKRNLLKIKTENKKEVQWKFSSSSCPLPSA